jgi:hypothetical protein
VEKGVATREVVNRVGLSVLPLLTAVYKKRKIWFHLTFSKTTFH